MLFANTRPVRITASALLMAWLFALTAGWANACVLQERSTHGHPVTVGSTTAVATIWAGHSGATPGHDGNSRADPALASCLKVCDNGSQSVVKPSSDPDRADYALAPAAIVAWRVVVAPSSSRASHAGKAPSLRAPVPLRIRYARLAL